MTAGVLHIDLETRSAVDLKKAGAYRYAEDPSTSIILGSYRFGDGPVQRWVGDSIPSDIVAHLNAGGLMAGHNQQFERVVLSAKGLRITPEQQDCTMARANAVGLPGALFLLGKALGLPDQKDMTGHALMMQMCKPRAVNPDGSFVWWDDPAKIERLASYCDQDVRQEADADKRLPRLTPRERRVWIADQKINDRGFAVDVDMVRRAHATVQEAQRRADVRMFQLTGGAVSKCTQTARIVAWLNARGLPCTSIAKGEVDEIILRADLMDDPLAADVIELRRASAKASTAKYAAILSSVCSDGRVRGSLAYHAAHTGRWAGRVTQPQNFPRVDDQEAVAAALVILRAARSAVAACDALEIAFDNPMAILSQCLRAMIIAPPGKKLIGGDFANIEGRVNAWYAGERWKLDAFRDYDEGVGADLYRLAYGRSFGLEPEAVDSAGRQIGKVMELALGYQGGVGAFQSMAAVYGLRVSNQRADALKTAWRAANPGIAASWFEYQDAAIAAVEAPGLVVPCVQDKVRYAADGKFLYCRLPSGRVIHYASPRVSWKTKTITTVEGDEIELNNRGVTYYAAEQGRWSPQDLYGGSQCDHVVQGLARDLLVEALFEVEAAGYPVVLTVHDELLCEVDEDFGDVAEFEGLMAALPDWAAGLPVAVKAWEDTRYVK